MLNYHTPLCLNTNSVKNGRAGKWQRNDDMAVLNKNSCNGKYTSMKYMYASGKDQCQDFWKSMRCGGIGKGRLDNKLIVKITK